MTYYFYAPKIVSVSITPNPANQNQSFLISVSVDDILTAFESLPMYAGNLYSGG